MPVQTYTRHYTLRTYRPRMKHLVVKTKDYGLKFIDPGLSIKDFGLGIIDPGLGTKY